MSIGPFSPFARGFVLILVCYRFAPALLMLLLFLILIVVLGAPLPPGSVLLGILLRPFPCDFMRSPPFDC